MEKLALGEQNKDEIKEISQDRINFKLTLRKKKFNNILTKKRIFPFKEEENPFTLELYLTSLNLPSNYKLIFAEKDELISTSLLNIKSENVLNVKYGICLLKTYLSYIQDSNELHSNLNLNFISDLLLLIEKWGERKEKKIIFNILYLIANYTYINNNKIISKILLSPKGYKVWNLCFDFQDYEIMSQLSYILNNITIDDNEASYNLIKSNFFQKKIFSFYSNPLVIRHLNVDNPENIFNSIIGNGVSFLGNILTVKPLSTYDKEEMYKLFIPIFELLLKYSESNAKTILNSCLCSVYAAIDNEERLINLINNSNILNHILNKKYFFNDKIILYSNRIIGEYINKFDKLSQDFYEKCVNYEMDILFSSKISLVIIEVYWVLSNIIHDSINSGEQICKNKLFIDKTINIYKNSDELKVIHDISYFFQILISVIDINSFYELIEKGVFEICLNHLKNNITNIKKLKILFELIELCLEKGDLLERNFYGKNIIKEKCEYYGLKDLLENYENSDDEELEEIINTIMTKYYEK